MEAIAKKQLSLSKNSHAIAKPKPKIRIIHIFAPEIIKTDVANFRELVQRLTGKPTETDSEKKPTETPARSLVQPENEAARRRVKEEEEEEEMWRCGFGGFCDFEGFIKELGEFPLMPLDGSHHQVMHGFEETQFA